MQNSVGLVEASCKRDSIVTGVGVVKETVGVLALSFTIPRIFLCLRGLDGLDEDGLSLDKKVDC